MLSEAHEKTTLELENLQKELSNLNQELKRREDEHSQTLRHMNQAHESDFEELTEQLSVAQSQAETKSSQLSELQQTVEALKQELEEAKASSGGSKLKSCARCQHKALLMHLERAEADLEDAEEQVEKWRLSSSKKKPSCKRQSRAVQTI